MNVSDYDPSVKVKLNPRLGGNHKFPLMHFKQTPVEEIEVAGADVEVTNTLTDYFYTLV